MNMHLIALTLLILVAVTKADSTIDFESEGCKEKPVELFFLLDSSSSIWQVDFQKQLKFVNQVIDKFDVSPNATRVGVASFSYSYQSNLKLTDSTTKDAVQAKVSSIHQLYGGTYTDVALTQVKEEGLSQDMSRPGVTRIAIVLTDGASFDGKKTTKAAKELKEDGVVVFAIGVGGKADEEELSDIASEPADKYMFHVRNYARLDTIKVNLTRYACEAQIQDEPEKVPVCGNNNAADVMFLVDPNALGHSDAMTVYQYIGNVTSAFNMASGNIRVGLQSQICTSGDVSLRGYRSQSQAMRTFGTPQFKGLRHMIKRLRTHSYKTKDGKLTRARHMAVIFVDDKLYNTKQILDEARRTKNYDVELFVVAIGDNVNEKALKTLCSSSVDRHYIRVPSYDHLYSMQDDFLQKFCHGL